MRELKFKCWDKKENHWNAEGEIMDLYYSAKCNAFMFDNDSYDLHKDVIFCQYTGLKDKNGKEIYEGDILQTIGDNNERLSKFKVYWGDACFMKEREDGEVFRIESSQKWLEVIGNIYENANKIAI